MIVKNEIRSLKKCFDSVKDHIDYWVISDTGSTDGTQKFIKDYFEKEKIEGNLFEDKWENFGFNRTKVFERAKQFKENFDYYLVIDADDIFEGNLDEIKNTEKEYICGKNKIFYGSLEYWRNQIFNVNFKWAYIGVLHEFPGCLEENKDNLPELMLNNCIMRANHSNSGSRSSDPEKYNKDAKILLTGILNEPKNGRYYFYLAQSYRDAGNNQMAIIWYKKRVDLGGWEEEVYFSLFQIGVCKERLGYDFEKEVLPDYMKAYNFRKTRLEALYRVVRYFRIKNRFKEGFTYGMDAWKNEFPKDLLFVEKHVHEFSFLDEFSICAYYCGFHRLSYDINKKLLENKHIPNDSRKRIQENLKFSINKLGLKE